MSFDTLWPASWPSLSPWSGAVAALAAALAWAGTLRQLHRRDLAALGAALGSAAGWAVTLGIPIASPRQLAERLPLLSAGGFAAGLALALLAGGRAWRLALGAGTILAAGAWWLAGAPVSIPDLRRVLVLLLAFGAAGAVATLEMRSLLSVAAALTVLLAAWWIAQPTGPWLVLAAAGVAASLGAWPGAAAWTVPAAMPLGLGLAGLAAGPVVARGAAADWTAAAAPFAALSLGPVFAARIGGRAGAAAGWLTAGGVPLLLTWLLTRGA